MTSSFALLGFLVQLSSFRIACGVERHGHSKGGHVDHNVLEVRNDAKIVSVEEKFGPARSRYAREATADPIMRHERPLQHSPDVAKSKGARTGGSVLDIKFNNPSADVTTYQDGSGNTSNALAPHMDGVEVQLTDLTVAEAEADKVGLLVSSAEAEAGLLDTVHTTPYPGKEDDTEEEEEKALMCIAIALIVICCAWSCGWVVFMRRFATKKEQIQAGLLEEDAGEEDAGEEDAGEEEEEEKEEEEQQEEAEAEGEQEPEEKKKKTKKGSKKEQLAEGWLTGLNNLWS
jgi:hypothetical protein